MYCPTCGGTNDEGARFCKACGGSLTPSVAQGPPPHVPNHLVWAILVTIFCCLPFGIVSIVYASKVNGLVTVGDIDSARKASKSAKTWAWVSFGIGLAIYGGVAIFGVFTDGNRDSEVTVADSSSVENSSTPISVPNGNSDSEVAVVDSSSVENSSTPISVSNGTKRTDPLPRGYSVTHRNLKLTVLDVDYSTSESGFLASLPEGHKWVSVKLRIEAVGDPNDTYTYNAIDFRMVGDLETISKWQVAIGDGTTGVRTQAAAIRCSSTPFCRSVPEQHGTWRAMLESVPQPTGAQDTACAQNRPTSPRRCVGCVADSRVWRRLDDPKDCHTPCPSTGAVGHPR